MNNFIDALKKGIIEHKLIKEELDKELFSKEKLQIQVLNDINEVFDELNKQLSENGYKFSINVDRNYKYINLRFKGLFNYFFPEVIGKLIFIQRDDNYKLYPFEFYSSKISIKLLPDDVVLRISNKDELTKTINLILQSQEFCKLISN